MYKIANDVIAIVRDNGVYIDKMNSPIAKLIIHYGRRGNNRAGWHDKKWAEKNGWPLPSLCPND